SRNTNDSLGVRAWPPRANGESVRERLAHPAIVKASMPSVIRQTAIRVLIVKGLSALASTLERFGACGFWKVGEAYSEKIRLNQPRLYHCRKTASGEASTIPGEHYVTFGEPSM